MVKAWDLVAVMLVEAAQAVVGTKASQGQARSRVAILQVAEVSI